MGLEISNLSFGYGKTPLFDRLSAAKMPRGSVTAVVGPNGVGKSSLFRLLAGLRNPSAGHVSLDGADVASWPQRQRHERIFFLSQHVTIRAALTVFDVVLLARKSGMGGRTRPADIAKVEEVLDMLGIEDLSDRTVTDLSGGQQQLVATAQAFVRNPQVLLLDEPTSALDLRRQLEVMELVRAVTIQRNIVTIMALHDLSLAGRFADRFLLLDAGRVVADGNPRDVLSGDAIEDAYGVGIHVERATTGILTVNAFLRSQRI